MAVSWMCSTIPKKKVLPLLRLGFVEFIRMLRQPYNVLHCPCFVLLFIKL